MIESVAMFSAVVLSFARIFYSGVTNRLGNLTKWREGGRGFDLSSVKNEPSRPFRSDTFSTVLYVTQQNKSFT